MGLKAKTKKESLRAGGKGGRAGNTALRLVLMSAMETQLLLRPPPANSAPAGRGKVGDRGGNVALRSARVLERRGAPPGAGGTVRGPQCESSPLVSLRCSAARPPSPCHGWLLHRRVCEGLQCPLSQEFLGRSKTTRSVWNLVTQQQLKSLLKSQKNDLAHALLGESSTSCLPKNRENRVSGAGPT